jgi:septum formation protein
MFQELTQPLVLASASATRRRLLEAAGLTFATRPAAVDEREVKRSARAEGASAEDAAMLLAALKAERVAAREPNAIVIGADQILVCDGAWFDKPEHIDAAREQLRVLRGKSHVLSTAVVCQRDGQRLWQHLARPRLVMRAVSDAFLDAYLPIEGTAITSSVGAYRVEGLGIHLFERIEGEHAAVLGLPMLPLLGFLRQHGVLLS